MINTLRITERHDPTYAAPNDPPAQDGMVRLSGVFDLRGPNGTIMATSDHLAALRQRMWQDGAPIITLASVGLVR